MDFSPPPGGDGKLDRGQREQLMQQVQAQMAMANAQELLQKLSEKCFAKCISKPGTSLDSSEQKCIAMCMDRYMDTWNLVAKSYTQRLQKEKSRMG
ncbi:hypothetical protein CAPTEDRAFT_184287 [Capitella teleta]|uniref:Mitochondrial import inner membrane translocase subunit n=1 Tax=Capitella teleta TaxID=283909 RepID=X1ZGX8_CAPTE|nr:hypothetical protein CAPTEDRAFT_184287 [Capitella teleta]|eukprot:ELU00350.1 hypothetical protein CAPTEDRAFT_184287 [Capitella teleta]